MAPPAGELSAKLTERGARRRRALGPQGQQGTVPIMTPLPSENETYLVSPACGTAQLRRVLRTKQPKRSRGSGLLFASGLRPAQQKQGTATKDVERSETERA